jgi:pimeloyl-ACP methyl ester carboxylesterase
MSRLTSLVLCFALLFAALPAFRPQPALAVERYGAVLLHDKNGMPEKGGLVETERLLRNVGVLIDFPELPWSRKRGFDATFQQALVEIGMAVQELRLNGATRIALVGHGLGANAALAYAASRGGVDALVCLAPSHDPERHREVFLPDVRKARNMLSAGSGDVRSQFMDVLQDKNYDLSTTAEVYLSYNDPDGEAVMPRSAAAIKTPVPILWVGGLKDPLVHLGRSYAFSKAPSHPKSSYEEVVADHAHVPSVAAPLVAQWVRSLAQ